MNRPFAFESNFESNRALWFESNVESNRPYIPRNTFHDGPMVQKSNWASSNQ